MAIPNYQVFMNPVLKIFAKLGTEIRVKDIEQQAADILSVPEEDRELMVKSGANSVVYSRIHWASYYLYAAGLLEKPRRGFYKISDAGKIAFESGNTINNKYLMQYPSFVAFQERAKTSSTGTPDEPPQEFVDPEEKINNAITELNAILEDDILTSLKAIDPKRFEQVVVDLMEAMDYGVGKATRYVGDGGIDGIIDEDELGLSKIYLQAKRYADGKVNEKRNARFCRRASNK
jgi:restriction system protein